MVEELMICFFVPFMFVLGVGVAIGTLVIIYVAVTEWIKP